MRTVQTVCVWCVVVALYECVCEWVKATCSTKCFEWSIRLDKQLHYVHTVHLPSSLLKYISTQTVFLS